MKTLNNLLYIKVEKCSIQIIKYYEQLEWNLVHEQFLFATKIQYSELAKLFLCSTSIILDKRIVIEESGNCFCDRKPKKLLQILNELSLKLNEDNNIVIQCYNVMIESILKSEKDSKAAFEQLVLQFPNQMVSYFYSGNFNYSTDNYLKAIEDFNKVIALCPQFSILYNYKGRCLHELEKYEEALDCFNKALSLQKNSLYYFGKQLTLIALEKNFEGLVQCHNILQLKRIDTDVYDNKGVNFQKLNNFRNALICYRLMKSLNQFDDSQLDPEQFQQNL